MNQQIQVLCEGISPVLFDRWPLDGEPHIQLGNPEEHPRCCGWNGPSKYVSTVEEVVRSRLYRGPNNEIGMPTRHLLGCLREAGCSVKIGRKAISNGRTTELSTFLGINEPFVALFDPVTRRPLQESDCQARVERAKGMATSLIRAKFERWAFKCTLSVDYSGLDGLTEEHMRKLLAIGGNRVGIGSFRPANIGPFGRFKVSIWKHQAS